MIFQRWDAIPKVRISHPNIPPESQIELQMVVGERQLLALWTFSKGAAVSAHRHPEEQVSYIRRGRFRYRVEDEGEREVGEGDVVVLRSNVEHELQALEEGSQDLQIFSPLREDLLEYKDAYIHD
ncbi:MAG: cupin domain-containing protein [Nitrospinota bacterium]